MPLFYFLLLLLLLLLLPPCYLLLLLPLLRLSLLLLLCYFLLLLLACGGSALPHCSQHAWLHTFVLADRLPTATAATQHTSIAAVEVPARGELVQ